MSDSWTLEDYQRGVIGATLLYFDQAALFRGRLGLDDFPDTHCRAAFSLFLRSPGFDDYLAALNAERLSVFVCGCMETSVAHMQALWENAILRLRDAAERRRIRQCLSELYQDGQGDLLARLADFVAAEQARRTQADENETPQRLAEQAIAALREDDRAGRLYTGISCVDAIVRGFRRGNLSILGAEPSCGKTALALNIAAQAVRNKRRVVVFSLEMAALQLMDRLLSAQGDIPYAEIDDRNLSAEQLARCETVALALTRDGLLYIYDDCFTVEQQAERMMALKPDLVIVDFLQFVRTMERRENTAERLEYIVAEYKRLAKLPYCPCHIMALSQPSRQATREGASMFALKGSSGIEQGGDVILLLDRPAVRDNAYPQEQAQLRVAKNKFGPVGVCDLYFDGAYQRFRALDVGEAWRQPVCKEEKPW